MENEFSVSVFEGKKRPSLERHRREKIWQILVPLFIWTLLILAVGAIVIQTAARSSAGGSVSQWADTSAIWLILPIIMVAIFGILILIGLIYLVARIIKILPPYADLIQGYASLIATRVSLVTRRIASPFITVESTSAGIKGFVSALFGKRRY